MMRARFSFFAALCVAAPVALAQDMPSEYDVEAWTARGRAMQQACVADRDSPECLLAIDGVRSDMAEAMLMLSERADRDTARVMERRMLALPPPDLRTAAAYALARTGPEPQDTPVLVALLNDPVPTVRRAAYGALSKSPDPAAREWVLRSKPQAHGDSMIPDRRALDPETLGVALPPGATPIWLEMEAWSNGGQLFTADGAPDDVLAHFASIAGASPVPLADIQARFADNADGSKALARFGNAAWFENPRVVVLADGSGVHERKPVRLAIVWQDRMFARTGFALQWPTPSEMPGRQDPPWRALSTQPQVTLDALGEPGSLIPDWRKPGADEAENAIYDQIVLSGGVGASVYLEQYPAGQYRAEVEAFLTKPYVTPVDENLVEPTKVRLRFANMPTDRPVRFDIVPRRSADGIAGMRVADPPVSPTEPVSGQASGEVTWTSGYLLKPGLYDIRVFYGPFEMDWDPEAIRKYLPGDEAQFRQTIRVLPRIVTLATDKADYAPYEPVQIRFEGMAAKGSPGVSSPFLTIVKAGAPDKEWQHYVYTEDQTAGTQTLEAPGKPGRYQVRALFAQDGIVHGIADITVLDIAPFSKPAAPPTSEPPAAPQALPSDPGIVMTLSKPVFAAGEPIIVSIKGMPGDKRDWVAIVPAGAPESTTGEWVRSTGVTEESFTLPGQKPGAYEIRVRFKDQYQPVRAWIAVMVQ